jgi:hypothetical protein
MVWHLRYEASRTGMHVYQRATSIGVSNLAA